MQLTNTLYRARTHTRVLTNPLFDLPLPSSVHACAAPVTICCASSFCLFPALSRSSGVTHLQHTPLLAQDQRVAISDHVKVVHTPLPPLTHIPALSSLP
jgi:hypothetical protein